MTSIKTHVQVIDVIIEEHPPYRCEYLVRTWTLTESQRRSLVKLLGQPHHEAYLPQSAVSATQEAAAQAGMTVVEWTEGDTD